MDNVCSWPMGNGQTLSFTIYSSNAEWNEVAGLYIFARQTNDNNWFALYVGQTDDFSSRLPSHEKWDSAVQRGATHIHAVVVSLAANRDEWEKRLIAHLQPPLNEQYKGLRYQLMSV
jgi:predicted GIY-YIG superfamily endonuclease